MKYMTCPPCGTVFEEETEDDIVRVTQVHAKEKHGYAPPRDEIVETITSTPPQSE